MKVKSLALGMILPLAASVALATAPTASAATPTTAAFTGSSAHGYRHHVHHRWCGHFRGYYDREANWNRNGYYPFDGPTFGGRGPVYAPFNVYKVWNPTHDYYDLIPG